MKKAYKKALRILGFTRWSKLRAGQGTKDPYGLFAKAVQFFAWRNKLCLKKTGVAELTSC